MANDYAELVGSVILLVAGGEVAPEPEVAAHIQRVFRPDATEAEILDAMVSMFGDPANAAPVWEAVKPYRSPEAARARQSAAQSTPLEGWAGAPGDSPWLIVQGSRDQAAPQTNTPTSKTLGSRS